MNLPLPMFSSPSKVLGLITATQRTKKNFSSYRISRASSHWAGFILTPHRPRFSPVSTYTLTALTR
uniref:Alternative protein STAMBP n=1 Tax=Homo sapiens TaxID=9606 RepID=L8ECD1_HUMAN|nr:alternative protein STAMBP [Homo sapiens]